MRGRGVFAKERADEHNPRWLQSISRKTALYSRPDDIRSEFGRDFNRILHCTAYRRLKHKTQVFFATRNDHVCTRIEHVNHVASISHTICNYLGLNTELSTAIALGHDIGHAPFGHVGETILAEIAEKYLEEPFWHERNSLWFADNLELLPDPSGNKQNLNLTYAVRDGIICHCGELNVNDKSLFPRYDFLDLADITSPGEYSPFTWEGCIVRIADKIAFLGRDLEDAVTLNLLTDKQIDDLKDILGSMTTLHLTEINNTVLIHELIMNLCENSNPADGVRFDKQHLDLINTLHDFSKGTIYDNIRLKPFKKYAELIIHTIFETLTDAYDSLYTIPALERRYLEIFPSLHEHFVRWLIKYSDVNIERKAESKYVNHKVYTIGQKNSYIRAILDFISGMTDSFAIGMFSEIASF